MDRKDIIIEGQNVSIGYKEGKKNRIVQEGLNFQLIAGELTCLLGGNGAGKSTLLRTLSASQYQLDGEIYLSGKLLGSYSEHEKAKKIGTVFTDRIFAGGLSVYELVSLGRQPHTGFFGRLSKRDEAIIEQALLSTGIIGKRNNYISELSDGERQKAMIAKALVQECPVIILDEPTAFLDVTSRIEITTLLRSLAEAERKAILMSTHDIEQALMMADSMWLLKENSGGITTGATEDLILDGSLDALYNSTSDISFNKEFGIFTPKKDYKERIQLVALDRVLYHWTRNALERNQYKCTENPCRSIPLIKVNSKDNITIVSKGQTYICSSIKEMLNILNFIMKK